MGVGHRATARKEGPDPRALEGVSCFYLRQFNAQSRQLPGAGTTGVCHHDQLTVCRGQILGPRACLASTLSAELHPGPRRHSYQIHKQTSTPNKEIHEELTLRVLRVTSGHSLKGEHRLRQGPPAVLPWVRE